MRVMIIGAGRVGCGALGVALAMQGHEVVFAVRQPSMIDALNRFGYDVETKGAIETLVSVRGVRAVPFSGDEFAREVAAADQIYTSVRPDNLQAIAPVLAQAILDRLRGGETRPVDIFCCENMKNSGAVLERMIFTYLPFAFAKQVQDRVGFNSAISDRVVAGQRVDASGRPVFTADAAGDVLFDMLHVKGTFDVMPPFKGLDNFPASMEEKLYILNCGHAVAAYLGHQHGYTFIHEAMADERINRSVVGAMLESQQALQGKHGRAVHYAGQINEVLAIFSNASLMDTIARVGRDPIRKLQADDRLVGPAKLAYRYGLEAPNLIGACAAALAFSAPGDPQADELQRLVADEGAEQALDTVSQLRPWNPLARMIIERFQAEKPATTLAGE
jgi:mannitol-1-phosphate 5-dehydrogenase